MKRSEMIERLACFLSEEQGCRKVSSYAEMIIEFLEGEGMLPPPHTLEQEVVNNPTGDTISVINYDWEDEQ